MTIPLGGGGPYAGDYDVSGYSSGRDFIDWTYPSSYMGMITYCQLYMRSVSGTTSIKMKSWTVSGANIICTGVSQAITVSAGLNQITLSSPFPCKVGDYVGLHMNNADAVIDGTVAGGNGYKWYNGDNYGIATGSLNAVGGVVISVINYGEYLGSAILRSKNRFIPIMR